MTDPSEALKLTGPPSVNVSTPGNPWLVRLQFAIANFSDAPTALRRGTLLVPLSTAGTNLTSGAVTPVPDTPGWTFARKNDSPLPGYAAFLLLPSDGEGTIPPGGSVAFALTAVTVASTPGAATVRFAAETTLGEWRTHAIIALNPPGTFFARAGLWPSRIFQKQMTVLSWRATGAAYCEVRDDQGRVWRDLRPAGPLAILGDEPVQGNSPTRTDTAGGKYYTRGYTLIANTAGSGDPTEWSLSVEVDLPTILHYAVKPQTFALGDQAVVSWKVANLHPVRGRITLTVAPQDGTAAQQIAIPLVTVGSPGDRVFGGAAAVTPTPLATTHYTLTIDNGYGATVTQTQAVNSPVAAGYVLISNLVMPDAYLVQPLAAFDGKLWWVAPVLSWSRDGVEWTQVSQPPGMSQIWSLLTADLGQGEVLCAFGFDAGNGYLAAWTPDGTAWHAMASPPILGVAVATAAGILLCGGYDANDDPLQQVWSSDNGADWTQVSNSFPARNPGWSSAVACFGDKVYAVPLPPPYEPGEIIAWSSSDGGKTWQPQPHPIATDSSGGALQVAGDELWLLGTGSESGLGGSILALDAPDSWSVVSSTLPAAGASGYLFTTTYLGFLWFGWWVGPDYPPPLYLLNQVLPGGFTLVPTQPGGGGKAPDSAVMDVSLQTP